MFSCVGMTSSKSKTAQTVLVTGGTGLVGSHVVQLLLEVEHARWRRERGARLEHEHQRVMLTHGDRSRVDGALHTSLFVCHKPRKVFTKQ